MRFLRNILLVTKVKWAKVIPLIHRYRHLTLSVLWFCLYHRLKLFSDLLILLLLHLGFIDDLICNTDISPDRILPFSFSVLIYRCIVNWFIWCILDRLNLNVRYLRNVPPSLNVFDLVKSLQIHYNALIRLTSGCLGLPLLSTLHQSFNDLALRNIVWQ